MLIINIAIIFFFAIALVSLGVVIAFVKNDRKFTRYVDRLED